jgi:hypothetical protein
LRLVEKAQTSFQACVEKVEGGDPSIVVECKEQNMSAHKKIIELLSKDKSMVQNLNAHDYFQGKENYLNTISFPSILYCEKLSLNNPRERPCIGRNDGVSSVVHSLHKILDLGASREDPSSYDIEGFEGINSIGIVGKGERKMRVMYS